MNDQDAFLLRRAQWLLDHGRLTEAIAAYRELVAADPELADCWYNLGWLLRAEGEYDQALDAYGQALAHGIAGSEEVHLNRAVIYSDHLRRDIEAERELQDALALVPDYAPALLNLGNLHEERGKREAAVGCYRRLLANLVDGDGYQDLRFEALARMAHLQPPISDDDPLLGQLRQAAVTKAGEPAVRANLLFALGRALDSLGLFDEAFAAFEKANRNVRQAGGGYDRGRSERTTKALITAFARVGEPVTSRATDTKPLFICGMFRSGSTLIEQVLAAHPQVASGGELDLLPRMAAGPLAPFPATMAAISPERVAELARDYCGALLRLFPSADHFVTDKRPDNFQYIGLIHCLFPEARIVHTVRHPLDNGLSLFTQYLSSRVAPYASDLADIGHYYGQYRCLMAHWKGLYPDSICDFDYDAFVREPKIELARLLDFLDLPWDEGCLEFHHRVGTVKTASYWQVRQPLYRQASGRWRSYQPHLEPLREALTEAGIYY